MKRKTYLLISIILIFIAGCAGRLSTLETGLDGSQPKMFPLSSESAERVLAIAMEKEFPGLAVVKVDYPQKGLQVIRRFLLDYTTYTAYMIAAKGRNNKGEIVAGYFFEVNHSGTMLIQGPVMASNLYDYIIREATLMSGGPLPLAPLQQ